MPTPALPPPQGPSTQYPTPAAITNTNVSSVFLTSCYLACPCYRRPRSPRPAPPRPAPRPPSCLLLKFFWVSASRRPPSRSVLFVFPFCRLVAAGCLVWRQGGDDWGTRSSVLPGLGCRPGAGGTWEELAPRARPPLPIPVTSPPIGLPSPLALQ